jgi:hypothetical protein
MVVRKKSLVTTYVEGMTKWSQDRRFSRHYDLTSASWVRSLEEKRKINGQKYLG